MNPTRTAVQVESAELLNQLRNVVPNAPAEYLGRLDEREPLAIVEAYLYVRQARLSIPADLYRALQSRALAVLGVVDAVPADR